MRVEGHAIERGASPRDWTMRSVPQRLDELLDKEAPADEGSN
ncbi:MAG: hypothetical protein ACK2U9_19575 [Anaerolineae bacterium]